MGGGDGSPDDRTGAVAGSADGPERQRLEFELQVTCGLGVTPPRAGGRRRWAGRTPGPQLGRRLGDIPRLYPVLFGLRSFHTAAPRWTRRSDEGEELLRLAQARGDPALILGHLAVGNALMFRAEFDAALPHFEQMSPLYDPLQHTFPLYTTVRSAGRVPELHGLETSVPRPSGRGSC